MSSRFQLITAILCAVCIAGALPDQASAQSAPAALTKIVFSLDFIPLGRHAPWYAAIAEGYYKEEGLDVSIIPSQGTAQTIQAIEAGTAQIGFTDVPSLAIARANGAKLKMVAVNYEKAPYAIFSLNPGANVTSPKQLEGLKLGSGAGSFTPKVIEGLMKQKGLDPDSLKIGNVAPPARASALLSGQVPAIEFFVMAKPGLEAGCQGEEQGIAHLSARRSWIETLLQWHRRHRGLSGQEFRRHEALRARMPERLAIRVANPEKAAADQIKYVPTFGNQQDRRRNWHRRGSRGDAAVEKNGLGWFDPAEMKANLDFMIKYIGVSGTPPAANRHLCDGVSAVAADHAVSRTERQWRRSGGEQAFRSGISRTSVNPSAAPGRTTLVAIENISFDLAAGKSGDTAGAERLRQDHVSADRRRPDSRLRRDDPDQRRDVAEPQPISAWFSSKQT